MSLLLPGTFRVFMPHRLHLLAAEPITTTLNHLCLLYHGIKLLSALLTQLISSSAGVLPSTVALKQARIISYLIQSN